MEDATIADLKTIVTEACMNVVVHAYGDDEGPMEVTTSAEEGELTVTVRDFGQGIRPRPALGDASLRLGIPLIAALASSFEIRGGPSQGTEVRMQMQLAGARAGDGQPPAAEIPREEGVVVEAGPVVAPVVSRVISALAARAGLSVDRLSDAILIGDAISARAIDDFPSGRAQIAVVDGDRSIEVRIGPLREGASERMLAAMELPGIGGSLQALADEVRTESGTDGERLLLRIGARVG